MLNHSYNVQIYYEEVGTTVSARDLYQSGAMQICLAHGIRQWTFVGY